MKKIITLLLTLSVILTLSACGNSQSKKDDKTITIACSPTPHAQILAQAKEILAKQGYNLEIREFEDYVQPIEVVESGELDANYFAHVPYLDNYNKEKGTHQTVAGKVLVDGDDIIVPNDGTNETRALLLLQDNGIITLPAGTGADSIVTVNDIVEYKVKVDIIEVDAPQVARYISEAPLVILNGNYALAAGLNVSKDAIAYEKSDSSAAKTYVNVVAVKQGNENNEGIKALVEVLKSQAIVDYINNTYEGAVVPFTE